MSGAPTIDSRLKTVSIPRRLMPPLLAVHSGASAAAAEMSDLKAGGFVGGTGLHPLVRSLIDVMTNPSLVVTVELTLSGSSHPRLATFWKQADTAAVGTGADKRSFELAHIEPALLPFHIAQFVGMVPRRRPRFEGSVQIPESALTQAEQRVAIDPAVADRALEAAGVPPLWIDRLLAALMLRRSAWVAESVWLGGEARGESRLCVLDGGFTGYWRLGNAGPDLITVSPATFDDLLERISALLP